MCNLVNYTDILSSNFDTKI